MKFGQSAQFPCRHSSSSRSSQQILLYTVYCHPSHTNVCVCVCRKIKYPYRLTGTLCKHLKPYRRRTHAPPLREYALFVYMMRLSQILFIKGVGGGYLVVCRENDFRIFVHSESVLCSAQTTYLMRLRCVFLFTYTRLASSYLGAIFSLNRNQMYVCVCKCGV